MLTHQTLWSRYCEFHEKIYVLEGPIDAMFIDNSIAMAGADASGLEKLLRQMIMFSCMITNHEI